MTTIEEMLYKSTSFSLSK